MKREERALRNLKQMCSDGRYLGSGSYIPLEVLEDFSTAIKALEQETVLDKIRAEIRRKMKFNSFNEGYVLYDDIIEVLDKHKAESEE